MEALMQHLAAAQQLHLPERIQQTAVLLTSFSQDLQDPSQGPARVQLQTSLCQALLASLQPQQAPANSNSCKPSQPAPALRRNAAAARRTAQRSAEQISPQAADADDMVIDDNEGGEGHPLADVGAAPLSTRSSQQQTGMQSGITSHPQQGAAAAAALTLAEAWGAAAPTLQATYTFEDEEVVMAVISFWAAVCELLHGSWLQQQQLNSNNSRQRSAPADILPTAAADSAAAANTTTSQQQLETTTTTTTAAAAGSTTACHQRYIEWLLSLGHSCLSAVVGQLHDFYCLTGISHLKHKQATPTMHLLLLYLQLQGDPSCSSSSSSRAGGSSSSRDVAGTGGVGAVQQLLQLVQWPQHVSQAGSMQHPSNFPQQQQQQRPGSSNSRLAATAGAAMKAGEAFAAMCKLLQAVSTLPEPATAAAAGTAANGGGRGMPFWRQLAVAAGSFLQSSYGWCQLDGQVPATAAAAAANGISRLSETLYDTYMMELLHAMLEGPWDSGGCSSSTSDAAGGTSGGEGSSSMLAPDSAEQRASKKKGSSSSNSGQRRQQQLQWEEWCSSNGFRALAVLVSSYDKPQLLVRGLVALVTQQQQQKQQRQGLPAGEAGIRPSSSQVDAATISQVLLLLEHVFLGHTDGQTPAAPARVCQLLLGCAELLRPAANCPVEWRCAALGLMSSAVEEFVERTPGDGGLHTQLWCCGSLEGLLYCLLQDTSIKARRAAIKLLQLVVLPNNSPSALQLVQTLAAKVCDKDSHVAQAALELLVQLDAQVLCGCLTAAQWCGVVQAGLEMCCSGSDSDGCGKPSAAAAGCGSQGHISADGTAAEREAAAAASSGAEGNPGGAAEDTVAAAAAPTPVRPAMKNNSSRKKSDQAAGIQGTKRGNGHYHGGKHGSAGGAALCSSGQQQFLQLLRAVLLCDGDQLPGVMHGGQGMCRQWVSANSHKCVGLQGCRLLLLLLLQDAQLEILCHRLQGQLTARGV